jgi:Icc-related predicted phosphoesterase
MRLLAFSDVHRDSRQAARLAEMAPEADVVIGAGDFASQHRGLGEVIDMLVVIEKPTVLVPGNSETDDELREACAGWRAATVLHGEGIAIDGVSFFGLGGGVPPTPWPWSFDLTEREAEEKLSGCPQGGVLVVHSPPRGHLDRSFGMHLGSKAIRSTIEDRRPRLAVFGHIHNAAGKQDELGETRLVNAGPDGVFLDLELE